MSTTSVQRTSAFARAFPRWDARAGWIVGLVALGALAMALMPRLAQPVSFHDFADRRALLGVPNFMDVVSNAPFAMASALGLGFLARRAREQRMSVVGGGGAGARLMRIDLIALTLVFLGIGFTCAGSSYYHLLPCNERLYWDRLPMVLTFVGLLVVLIAERVSPKTAAWLMAPLLLAAFASVTHWRVTEAAGRGDLRAYFFVEGAALVSVLLIVALYPARYLPTRGLMIGLACYGLAVLFELLDRPVWNLLSSLGVELVSGHTIKHLWASAGALVLAWAVRSEQVAAGE